MREVVGAVASEVGIERTGIRLSPIGESQGANDSDNADRPAIGKRADQREPAFAHR